MIPKKKIQKYIKEGTKLSADSVLDILKDYPDHSFEVSVIGVFHRTFVFNYEDKDRIYVSDFSSAAEDYYLEEVEFLEYFGDYFIKLDQFIKVYANDYNTI